MAPFLPHSSGHPARGGRTVMAGLLACGSSLSVAFPEPKVPVADDGKLAAYSAGAAAAWALESRTAFPFDPFSGTVTVKLRGRSAAVKATVRVHDYPDGRLAI